MNTPTRVLILDESVLARHTIARLLEDNNNQLDLCLAANASIAMAKLKTFTPDLIFLDSESDSSTLRRTFKYIQSVCPDTAVVMLSSENEKSEQNALWGLQAGATEVLMKPPADPSAQEAAAFLSQFDKIMRVLDVRQNVRTARALTQIIPKKDTKTSPERVAPVHPKKTIQIKAPPTTAQIRFDVVAIGVSTGGPGSLMQVLPQLPANLGVPILIVQHMPPTFTTALAANLNEKSNLTILEGEDGMPIDPNHVYLAPGGKHMEVRRKDDLPVIHLHEAPPVNSCRPSVDVLFRSVASFYAGHILSVIMTGMGNDGCEGVRRMKESACYCISQSESTCTVYGMPRAVDEAGLSDERVPLDMIPARITGLVRASRTGKS